MEAARNRGIADESDTHINTCSDVVFSTVQFYIWIGLRLLGYTVTSMSSVHLVSLYSVFILPLRCWFSPLSIQAKLMIKQL